MPPTQLWCHLCHYDVTKMMVSMYIHPIINFYHCAHATSCMFADTTHYTSSHRPSLRNSLRTTWERATSSISSSPSLTTTSREWRCRRLPLKISMTQMWWVLTIKIKDFFFSLVMATTDWHWLKRYTVVTNVYSSAVFDRACIASQAWFSWVTYNMIMQ